MLILCTDDSTASVSCPSKPHKCSTCRLLHITVYINKLTVVLPGHSGLLLHPWMPCLYLSLNNTSIQAAADSGGGGLHVDQMWKWSVNAGELEARVLTASTLLLSVSFLFPPESLWADQPAKGCEMAALGSHPSNPHGRPPEGPSVVER